MKINNLIIMKNKELVLFQVENGALELRTDEAKDTVWANLEQISVLLGRDKSVVSRHIKNIFKDRELERDSTVAIFATVRKEGKRNVEIPQIKKN